MCIPLTLSSKSVAILNSNIKVPKRYGEDDEALEQVAQRSCGCPIIGSVQGQAGRGFEQPGLVDGVPAHGRGVQTRWSLRSLPTQTILWKASHYPQPNMLLQRVLLLPQPPNLSCQASTKYTAPQPRLTKLKLFIVQMQSMPSVIAFLKIRVKFRTAPIISPWRMK